MSNLSGTNRIAYNPERGAETKTTVTAIVDTLRELANKADELTFGKSGEHESTGPCADHMEETAKCMGDTIRLMADVVERTSVFLMQAGIRLEETDQFLARSMES